MTGIRRAECSQRGDDRTTWRTRLRREGTGESNAPRSPVSGADAGLVPLPHTIARITGPIIRNVATDRTEASVVREFCGFDNCRRIVRLKGSGEVIGGVGVSAEELQLPRLLADRDLDSLIDEPVPLVVRHIVGIVQCRIDFIQYAVDAAGPPAMPAPWRACQ